MFARHASPAHLVPDRISSQESPLSPEWIHFITTLMGHPLSSESRKCIQKWILYHAITDQIDFWLTWDPTDPDDIKLLQHYVDRNGSIVNLTNNTVKESHEPLELYESTHQKGKIS